MINYWKKIDRYIIGDYIFIVFLIDNNCVYNSLY